MRRRSFIAGLLGFLGALRISIGSLFGRRERFPVEDEEYPRDSYVRVAASASNGQLLLSNADQFQLNEILNVPRTGEQMMVSGIAVVRDAYGNVVTHAVVCDRGVGSPASALLEGDHIWVIGRAEYSDSPGAPLSEPGVADYDALAMAKRLANKSLGKPLSTLKSQGRI